VIFFKNTSTKAILWSSQKLLKDVVFFKKICVKGIALPLQNRSLGDKLSFPVTYLHNKVIALVILVQLYSIFKI